MSRNRNIRFVPAELLAHISTFEGDSIIAACAIEIRPENIAQYAHLGIDLANDGRLVIPPPFVPSADRGRFSHANRFGWSRPIRSLPKVRKFWDVEAPNYGDPIRTHTVTFMKWVYPREHFSAKEVELKIDVLDERQGAWIVRFVIDQVIDKTTPNFEHELFFNLNILQENVGENYAFESGAGIAEYLPTVRVHWELLPVGTVDEILAMVMDRLGDDGNRRGLLALPQMQDRIAVLRALEPDQVIVGRSNFSRYVGVLWNEGLAVFENARYGNAIYVMAEDWEELSQKSRLELMRSADERYRRIVHTPGWQSRLRHAVHKALNRTLPA